MITTKWFDFSICDLTWNDKTEFTQEYFEEYVGDKFEAVEINDETKLPEYIWTTKYVFYVKDFFKYQIGNPAIIGCCRNWEDRVQ